MPKISLLKLKNILKKTNKCSSLNFDFREVSGLKNVKKYIMRMSNIGVVQVIHTRDNYLPLDPSYKNSPSSHFLPLPSH